MKRLLLPLLAAIALPKAVNSGISDKVHKKCLEARDYEGCVQVYTKRESSPEKRVDIWTTHPLAGKSHIYDGTMWQPPNWELVHVLAGSSAEYSGLLLGDKLLKINGYEPNKFAWPMLKGEEYKQGTLNTYEIKRGKEILKIRTKNNDYFVPHSSKIFY